MNKTPKALDLLKTNAGAKQQNASTTSNSAGSDFPSCPRHMKGAHRKVWNEVKKSMAKFEVITDADAAILEQYCVLMALLRSNPDEFTASLHSQLRGLASDLYLTPESRTRAGIQSQNKEDDPLHRYGL